MTKTVQRLVVLLFFRRPPDGSPVHCRRYEAALLPGSLTPGGVVGFVVPHIVRQTSDRPLLSCPCLCCKCCMCLRELNEDLIGALRATSVPIEMHGVMFNHYKRDLQRPG